MKKAHIALITASLIISGCTLKSDEKSESVRTGSAYADEYFTSLFMGDCSGFTGSDGTYSVQLPDGRTAWIFGDTFIEGVNPDNTRKPQDPMYVRNSIVVQDGDSMRTLYNKVDGRNASFAIPPVVTEGQNGMTEDSVWFWPGDGYIQEDQLMIFFSEFAQVDTGMWGFEWRGTWIGSYTLPELRQNKLMKLRDNSETDIHFGHAIYEDTSYIYIYGAGKGQPHAARYKRCEVTGVWEYFDGTDWQEDISNAAPMSAVSGDGPTGAIDGSEQFSIFRLDDRFVLLTQLGSFSGDIVSFTSEAPTGPWENKTKLYTTPLPDSTNNLFTYNALAHPQFTEDGMLLVSYNTNSHVLMDHFRDAMLYRPRFVRIPLQWIIRNEYLCDLK